MVTRACALALVLGAGCSLLELDDLDLEACREDLDCHALSREAGACFRCVSGRCERRGSLHAKRLETVSALAWLSSASSRERQTLLALTAQDGSVPARGVALAAGAGVAGQAIEYGDGPTTDQIRAIALAWFGRDRLVGLTVDTGSCAAGRLRVGLSTVEQPFTLHATNPRTLYVGGVDVDQHTQCSGTERSPGVRAPAVAALPDDAGAAEALLVWLGTSYSGSAPHLGRCADEGGERAPLEALRLRLRDNGELAWFEAADQPRPQRIAKDVLAATQPRLLASELGYLIAFVDSTGLQLRALAPARALGDLDQSAIAKATLPDPEANHVALALGAARGGGRDVLVVWSSQCESDAQLRAAVLDWRSDRLTVRSPPLSLTPSRAIDGAPAVAYAETGFARSEPQGGWAVAWSERTGDSSALRAVRFAASELARVTPETLHTGDVRFPFILADENAPFAFGFVGASTELSDDLTLMSCE